MYVRPSNWIGRLYSRLIRCAGQATWRVRGNGGYSGIALARLARFPLRLWRSTCGTAAVEFAFVCPLLIVLLLGVYTVGSVMHCISSVRHALEETARMLQMNPKLTQGDLQQAIDTKLENYGEQAVTLTMAVHKDSDGSDIARLTASYPYLIAVPFIPKYEGAYRLSVDIFLVIAP